MINLKAIQKLTDESQGDITPSHINVEIIPDDVNVDADITINIDTEEAKKVRLMMEEYDELQLEFFTECDKLCVYEDYMETIGTYGLDKAVAHLMQYDTPDVRLPSVDHLDYAVPDGVETKLALESLSSAVDKGYNVIKGLLEKFTDLLDRMAASFKKIFGLNVTEIEKVYDQLKQRQLADIKLSKVTIKAMRQSDWAAASGSLRRLEALRTAMLMAQFTSDVMDSKRADQVFNGILSPVALAAAANGTLDPNDAKPMISRWILKQMPKESLNDLGVTEKPNGDFEISPSTINRWIHRYDGTFESLGWKASDIMAAGRTARGLIEFGTSLPRLYGSTQATVRNRITHIEHSISDRYQPNTIKGLRRDRFRYKVYLIAMSMTNKLMWHVSKMSINVSNEWLHIGKVALRKGTL